MADQDKKHSADADDKEGQKAPKAKDGQPEKEIGGRVGPEPTRYGDWEKNGIISDF